MLCDSNHKSEPSVMHEELKNHKLICPSNNHITNHDQRWITVIRNCIFTILKFTHKTESSLVIIEEIKISAAIKLIPMDTEPYKLYIQIFALRSHFMFAAISDGMMSES